MEDLFDDPDESEKEKEANGSPFAETATDDPFAPVEGNDDGFDAFESLGSIPNNSDAVETTAIENDSPSNPASASKLNTFETQSFSGIDLAQPPDGPPPNLTRPQTTEGDLRENNSKTTQTISSFDPDSLDDLDASSFDSGLDAGDSLITRLKFFVKTTTTSLRAWKKNKSSGAPLASTVEELPESLNKATPEPILEPEDDPFEAESGYNKKTLFAPLKQLFYRVRKLVSQRPRQSLMAIGIAFFGISTWAGSYALSGLDLAVIQTALRCAPNCSIMSIMSDSALWKTPFAYMFALVSTFVPVHSPYFLLVFQLWHVINGILLFSFLNRSPLSTKLKHGSSSPSKRPGRKDKVVVIGAWQWSFFAALIFIFLPFNHHLLFWRYGTTATPALTFILLGLYTRNIWTIPLWTLGFLLNHSVLFIPALTLVFSFEGPNGLFRSGLRFVGYLGGWAIATVLFFAIRWYLDFYAGLPFLPEGLSLDHFSMRRLETIWPQLQQVLTFEISVEYTNIAQWLFYAALGIPLITHWSFFYRRRNELGIVMMTLLLALFISASSNTGWIACAVAVPLTLLLTTTFYVLPVMLRTLFLLFFIATQMIMAFEVSHDSQILTRKKSVIARYVAQKGNRKFIAISDIEKGYYHRDFARHPAIAEQIQQQLRKRYPNKKIVIKRRCSPQKKCQKLALPPLHPPERLTINVLINAVSESWQ